jgi:hypothetical protein
VEPKIRKHKSKRILRNAVELTLCEVEAVLEVSSENNQK